MAAARAHHAAGDWARARNTATALLAETSGGTARAEVLVLLAELSLAPTEDLLQEALHEATSPELRAVICCRLAWATRFDTDRDHAEAALQLARGVGDPILVARALTVGTILAWFAGDGPTEPNLLEALSEHLPSTVGGERLVQEATIAMVNTFAPKSMRERARALLEGEYEAWHERDELRSARASWGLAWVELYAGRWERAADHAGRAYDLASQYGQEIPQDLLPVAVVAVHRGELGLARQLSERALALCLDLFGEQPVPQHHAVLGLVARWRGDTAGALERLAEADRWAAALGWREPSVRWWTADHVELHLESGRLDDATELLDRWAADASRTGREVVLAHVTRSRGLVAAARGDVVRAIELLERAVVEHDAVGDPFGGARAQLALGAVRRRARQKAAARRATATALEAFEALGASCWVERARAELGRIGGRRRVQGLTTAESRVAALVAQGRTNREIAAALFLGERTVATHLTHVYAKLGVRSRTELASRFRVEAPV
jgi:DNA-binding CsgD family transcriptional regulator